MYEKQNLDQTSLDLLAAADYIKEHGHCKGLLFDEKGRVCAWGAFIKVADHSHHREGKAASRLRKYLKVSSLPSWNNATERTAEEVMNAMREAAYSPFKD